MLKTLFKPSLPQVVELDGISFSIKYAQRANMKRIIMRLSAKNELRLSASRLSKKQVNAFILENKTWVLQQHGSFKDIYAQGASFYYLNEKFSIEHHSSALCFKDKSVYLHPTKAKLQCDNFYKTQAKAYLPERVQFWQEKMDLYATELGFRLAKRRWGSCNAKGKISLNPYMMKLSFEMIDYIIIHELSHLKHLNHSKEFYQCIQDYMPRFKEVEKEIKALSLKLH